MRMLCLCLSSLLQTGLIIRREGSLPSDNMMSQGRCSGSIAIALLPILVTAQLAASTTADVSVSPLHGRLHCRLLAFVDDKEATGEGVHVHKA